MAIRSSLMTAVALCAALSAASSGCSKPDDDAAPTLTVTPTEWSLPAGGTPKQFTATLTGSSDPIVWSVGTAGTASEVGSISETGLFTPPPSLASGRDVIVAATAGALVARATVHVDAAIGGVTLAVTPATGSVVAGSTDTVALHAETGYVGTVEWSVAPVLGTLDTTSGANVVYSAPQGLVTADTSVVVTATAGELSDTATISRSTRRRSQ
jgi:hypothetical protein